MLASSTKGVSVQSVFNQRQLSQEQRTKIFPSVCSNLGRVTEHANIHMHTIYLLIYLHMYTYITAHTRKYVQTFILTYVITPWTRVLLVMLTVSQLVKKFPVLYGSESSLPLLQELASCP